MNPVDRLHTRNGYPRQRFTPLGTEELSNGRSKIARRRGGVAFRARGVYGLAHVRVQADARAEGEPAVVGQAEADPAVAVERQQIDELVGRRDRVGGDAERTSEHIGRAAGNDTEP